DSAHYLDFAPHRRPPDLALQLRLGLLPFRRVRTHRHHPYHPLAHGTALGAPPLSDEKPRARALPGKEGARSSEFHPRGTRLDRCFAALRWRWRPLIGDPGRDGPGSRARAVTRSHANMLLRSCRENVVRLSGSRVRRSGPAVERKEAATTPAQSRYFAGFVS